MKKGFLFLAGSALILASCGSNNNNEGQSKAQIDSTVNAQVAAKEAAMKNANDSTIAAQAKAKADSEMIAKNAVEQEKSKEHHSGGGHHSSTEAASPAAAAPATPAPAPAPGGLRGHADNATQNPTSPKPSGGGLRGHADQNQGH